MKLYTLYKLQETVEAGATYIHTNNIHIFDIYIYIYAVGHELNKYKTEPSRDETRGASQDLRPLTEHSISLCTTTPQQIYIFKLLEFKRDQLEIEPFWCSKQSKTKRLKLNETRIYPTTSLLSFLHLRSVAGFELSRLVASGHPIYFPFRIEIARCAMENERRPKVARQRYKRVL